MSDALRLAALPAPEVSEWAKTLAAIGGVVGAVWALGRRVWSVWRRRHRLRALEGKAIRYLLDAQRHTLHFVTPTAASRLISVDELLRQKMLIDDVREELWVADGHKTARAAEEIVGEVVKVLTRTQRIRLKDEGEQ